MGSESTLAKARSLTMEALRLGREEAWDEAGERISERDACLEGYRAAAGDEAALQELQALNHELLTLSLEYRRARIENEAGARRQANAASRYLST